MATGVQGILKEMDDSKSSLSTLDATSVQALDARLRYCACAEELLVRHLDFALQRKTEHDVWNVAFRSPLQLVQTATVDNSKSNRKDELQCIFTLILDSATSFYTQLLQRLCVQYRSSFGDHLKLLALPTEPDWEVSETEKPNKSSLRYLIQHCLIHLGDIARYGGQTHQAVSYYNHALRVDSSNGQVYNQLALLSTTSNSNQLLTTYLYVRAICIAQPFSAASSNFERLFGEILAKNDQVTQAVKQQHLNAHQFIAVFLNCIANIHTSSMEAASSLITPIESSLGALVLADKLSRMELIRLVAIAMYAVERLVGEENRVEGDIDVEGAALSADERKMVDVVFDLIAALTRGLLMPFHAYADGLMFLECGSLPALHVLFQWLISNPSLVDIFRTRIETWNSLCKIIETLTEVMSKIEVDEKHALTPLAEDVELRYFYPLNKIHGELRFSRSCDDLKASICNELRGQRLVAESKRLRSIFETERPKTVIKDNASKSSGDTDLVAVAASSSSDTVGSTASGNRDTPASGSKLGKKSRQNVALEAILQQNNGNNTAPTVKNNPGVLRVSAESISKAETSPPKISVQPQKSSSINKQQQRSLAVSKPTDISAAQQMIKQQQQLFNQQQLQQQLSQQQQQLQQQQQTQMFSGGRGMAWPPAPPSSANNLSGFRSMDLTANFTAGALNQQQMFTAPPGGSRGVQPGVDMQRPLYDPNTHTNLFNAPGQQASLPMAQAFGYHQMATMASWPREEQRGGAGAVGQFSTAVTRPQLPGASSAMQSPNEPEYSLFNSPWPSGLPQMVSSSSSASNEMNRTRLPLPPPMLSSNSPIIPSSFSSTAAVLGQHSVNAQQRMQNLWVSTQQSPLEKLLEQQQKQQQWHRPS